MLIQEVWAFGRLTLCWSDDTNLGGLNTGDVVAPSTADVDKFRITSFGDVQSLSWANYVVIQVVVDGGTFNMTDQIIIDGNTYTLANNTVHTGVYRIAVWHPYWSWNMIEFEITGSTETYILDWWVEPDADMGRISQL